MLLLLHYHQWIYEWIGSLWYGHGAYPGDNERGTFTFMSQHSCQWFCWSLQRRQRKASPHFLPSSMAGYLHVVCQEVWFLKIIVLVYATFIHPKSSSTPVLRKRGYVSSLYLSLDPVVLGLSTQHLEQELIKDGLLTEIVSKCFQLKQSLRSGVWTSQCLPKRCLGYVSRQHGCLQYHSDAVSASDQWCIDVVMGPMMYYRYSHVFYIRLLCRMVLISALLPTGKKEIG